MTELTQSRLKELFHYDPDTGVFTRLVGGGNAPAGTAAKGGHSGGYMRICVDGRRYFTHRLAWLYMTGAWPKDQVDHINGVRSANQFCNLREATNGENQQNITVSRRNKSGLVGVSWSKIAKMWIAQIQVNKVPHHLGYYKTKDSAHRAYLAAKQDIHKFQPIPREAL